LFLKGLQLQEFYKLIQAVPYYASYIKFKYNCGCQVVEICVS